MVALYGYILPHTLVVVEHVPQVVPAAVVRLSHAHRVVCEVDIAVVAEELWHRVRVVGLGRARSCDCEAVRGRGRGIKGGGGRDAVVKNRREKRVGNLQCRSVGSFEECQVERTVEEVFKG